VIGPSWQCQWAQPVLCAMLIMVRWGAASPIKLKLVFVLVLLLVSVIGINPSDVCVCVSACVSETRGARGVICKGNGPISVLARTTKHKTEGIN
jgi:hypothetical protein